MDGYWTSARWALPHERVYPRAAFLRLSSILRLEQELDFAGKDIPENPLKALNKDAGEPNRWKGGRSIDSAVIVDLYRPSVKAKVRKIAFCVDDFLP